MKYSETTGRTIQHDFETFHAKHPEVYEHFKNYTREIILAQRQRGIPDSEIRSSSKMILNRIRWEIAIKGLKSTTPSEANAKDHKFNDFKINDAFTSRYARMFMEDHFDFREIFNIRTIRSL